MSQYGWNMMHGWVTQLQTKINLLFLNTSKLRNIYLQEAYSNGFIGFYWVAYVIFAFSLQRSSQMQK